MPTVGSQGVAFSYERGTHVGIISMVSRTQFSPCTNPDTFHKFHLFPSSEIFFFQLVFPSSASVHLDSSLFTFRFCEIRSHLCLEFRVCFGAKARLDPSFTDSISQNVCID